MPRKLSEAEVKGLKNLMKGAPYDKGLAEKTLLEQNPDDLPEGVLDPWLKSRSKFDRERLLRVLDAWGKKLEDFIPEQQV
jgi:hypothetical protein